MKYYIGLDLGTSGLKGLLVDGDGNIIKEENATYPVYYPKDGWSEQNPEDWLNAAEHVLSKLSCGVEDKIEGLSFGGQMHGLVILDKDDNVIRPAILWNDGRSVKEVDYLNCVLGKDTLSHFTANIAFAGFTMPKLIWLKFNERENFARIAKIMLPKDYLAYKLTGVFSTDYSDASGTLLLDVKNKCWSKQMCSLWDATEEQLPKLFESFEVTGKVLPKYNLPNCKVIAGAGDNAAAAVGMGTVQNGSCNISLGTSGTIFIAQDNFSVDKRNALHSFVHANGKWHLMGCILSAASCNSWWMSVLNSNDFAKEQQDAEKYLGNNDVYFLPYLMGERSPHNDVNARGAFIGLRPDTTRKQMTVAVMEGVAYALRDCIEVARASGLNITKATVCGGGAKSELWKKIIANVLNVELYTTKTEQGPAYGGAILAMVGAGRYNSVEEATAKLVEYNNVIYQSPELVASYNARYQKFKMLYPALEEFFAKNAKM
jgi:xylulokinase